MCTDNAIAQGYKLLEFHFGTDSRIEINDLVNVLNPIENPVNSLQKFDVLEVTGYIYKAQYRMRFTYAQLNDSPCLLMGQEILEYANL